MCHHYRAKRSLYDDILTDFRPIQVVNRTPNESPNPPILAVVLSPTLGFKFLPGKGELLIYKR